MNQLAQQIRGNSDFLHRTRQYTIRLKLRDFRTEQSRQAWEHALLVQDQLAVTLPPDFAATGDVARQRFLEFVLKLARTLMQQAKVPVFTDLLPIRLQEDDGENGLHLLTLQVPVIDFIFQEAIPILLETSARVAVWVAEHQPSASNRERIFAAITSRVLMPLSKKVHGGKSTIPVLDAAHRRGIPYLHLGAGIYQLGWGSKAKRMDRSATEKDSYSGMKLSQSKVLTANLLRIAGFPAPVHEKVSSEQEAIEAAQRLGFPLVVKPLALDRGEGVTVDIRDDTALAVAFKHACLVARRTDALVERQVNGVCHRLFVADCKLLYAVARMPMSITADGSSTIALLVTREQERQQERAPWLRTEIKPLDPLAHEVLATHGYTPESIPRAGTVVPLRRIESTADGGIDIDVTSGLHPENEALAVDAARLVGLQMAGVDIISPDISEPWYCNGAIISEINFSPLLGGGAISRAAIPRFLSRFIEGDGRIPLEACADRTATLLRQGEWVAQGLRCYSTGADWTLYPDGRSLAMPLSDLTGRLQALIYRGDVDAIVYCT